jgi:hypothetical protein
MLSKPRRDRWIFLCALIVLTAVSAQAQSPVGLEFRVNSQSINAFDPDIAAGLDGVFTVVWPHANDPSEGPEEVTAREFSSKGHDSLEFNLVEGSVPFHTIDLPKVAPAPRGGGALFYTQSRPTGDRQILESRFLDDGSSPGSPFVVSKPLPSIADLHAVASLPSGGYFIIAEDDLCPGCRYPQPHIFARVLGPMGRYVSSYFLVDTDTSRASFSGARSLGVDAAGHAVVVWETQQRVVVPKQTTILGQRFSPTGKRLADSFLVSKPGVGMNVLPSVAVHPAGDFVVVWQFQPDADTPRSVHGRRFSKSGAPVGEEFVIEADPVADSIVPSIAGDSQGNFVVVWTSFGPSFCPSVKGRLYHPDGTPFGPSFPLASSADSCDEQPQVAFGPDGIFGVVWTRDLDDGGSDIYAALFKVGR